MIKDDVECEQTINQISNLKMALLSLRHSEKVIGTSKNFQVIAEGTIDEIIKLEDEVSKYLKIETTKKRVADDWSDHSSSCMCRYCMPENR